MSHSGDGRNPSPLGEGKIVAVPEGDKTPPTEVGGLRMKRAHLSRLPVDAPAQSPGLSRGLIEFHESKDEHYKIWEELAD